MREKWGEREEKKNKWREGDVSRINGDVVSHQQLDLPSEHDGR